MILLLAPTGVTAVNINGITIHFGLGIGIDRAFCLLGNKQLVLLRNKLSYVKVIIIDEVSIVSSMLFNMIKHPYIARYFMPGHAFNL